MSVLSVVIYALVVLIAVMLIALILVQPSKSGGFGSAFGGIGESVLGAHAMSHLSKLTVILITCFFVLTLLLAIVSGHIADAGQKSVMESGAAVSAAAPAVKPDLPAKTQEAAAAAEKALPANGMNDVKTSATPEAKK